MQEDKKDWNKKKIYTIVGYYLGGHDFQTLDNKIYKLTTYRIIRNYFSDKLVAINIKWHPIIEDWIIFQCVNFE